ncbi:MAG: hypothetical protein KGO96_03180 [Elusimicrobia bacterium]|nr:hypothetical protein [Elusimicrobiota bacterium]MDE2424896.1 hypothetical protein [Elusimicrobiota bacterium]
MALNRGLGALRSALVAGLTLSIQLQFLVAAEIVFLGGYLGQALTNRVDGPALLALLLAGWAAYAFDRWVIHPEDQAAAGADLRLLRYASRHRRLFAGMFAAAFLATAALLWNWPSLAAGFFFGGALTAAYVLDLPLLGRRMKSIPYLKSFYVPSVVVGTSLLLLGVLPRGAGQWRLAGGVWTLVALNTVLFDFKDRENDRRAGIVTLANRFSPARVAAACQALSLLLGAWFWSLRAAPERALALALLALGAAILRFYGRARVPIWYYLLFVDGVVVLPWIFLELAR